MPSCFGSRKPKSNIGGSRVRKSAAGIDGRKASNIKSSSRVAGSAVRSGVIAGGVTGSKVSRSMMRS